MPERDRFDKKLFTDNPMKDENALSAYKRLQWGNEPREVFAMEAPEPMAVLGDVAMIDMITQKVKFDENEYFLAVGIESNLIYLVPKDEDGKPIDFEEGWGEDLEEIAPVKQTDYISEKGGESCYYFHEHEDPFPMLCSDGGNHFVILPAETDDGARSYAVSDEGIIG